MNFLIFNQVSYSVLCSKENTINKSISIQCRSLIAMSTVRHTESLCLNLTNSFSYTYLPLVKLFSFYKNNTGKLKEYTWGISNFFSFLIRFSSILCIGCLKIWLKQKLRNISCILLLSFSVFIYFGETVFKCMIIFYTNRLGEWVFSWFWRPLDKTDAN